MSENKFIFLWITFSVLFVITISIFGYAWDSPNINRYIFIPFFVLLCIFAGYLVFLKTNSESLSEQMMSKKLFDAREEEKKKMAGELHDGLQQELHAIEFELKRLSKTNYTPRERIETLAGKVIETIEEVRRISYELYPMQLERLGLQKAIIEVANNLGDMSDVYFSVKIDEEFEQLVNLEASIQIYRIIQELFSNVVRHSGAKRANLTLSHNSFYLNINLTDDGQGFEYNFKKMNRFREGMGLNSIKERLRLMGGKIEIESKVGKGSEIDIRIPVKNIYNS